MTQETLTSEEARRRLYEILDRNTPFQTKAEQALDLGKSFLGVDNGHVTKIDPHTDYWEAIASTDSDTGEFPPGLICDLRQTYCRRTVQQDTSIALHDAPAQGWADDPAFDTHGLRSYHGTAITLDDDTFGTICFVAESSREPFTAAETMFAELIAKSLKHELESHQYEDALTRQSNLSTVLNRVLRHNLRNSVTVIRGRAEHLIEQFPDATGAQSIIDEADKIIELSEKARVLELVIVEEFGRQDTSLEPLIQRVVQEITTEYPTASMTVDDPENVSLAVRPSLERALYELLENAVKHTDAEPSVKVAVESVPNAVQIRIDDNGPGLPEIEQQALAEGIETPLAHGSGLGLWLTYWVVTGHDGTIDVTVSENGTTMVIELPRKAATADSNLTETDRPALQRVQDKFRAVFEEACDAMLIANDDGRYIDANQRAADLFGVQRQQLLGRSIDEFTPEEIDIEEAWQEFRESGRERGTFPIVRPDGTQRTVEYNAEADIVPGQHLTILRDVTEREDRIQRIELAETVFQNTQDAIFLIDVTKDDEFRVQRVNDAFEDLTGLLNAEIQGQTPREIVGAEIGTQIEAQYRECVARRETIRYPEEIPVDGKRRHWETKLTPVIENDSVVKLVGAMRDVTDSRERENELARLEQSLETILSNVPVVFWVTDEEGVFTRSRGAGLEAIGLEPGEVVGDSVFEIYNESPDICAAVSQALDGEPVSTTVAVDGTKLETWHHPVLTDDDEIIGTVGLAYITDGISEANLA
jgi:PAS domain S-box-containing protein